MLRVARLPVERLRLVGVRPATLVRGTRSPYRATSERAGRRSPRRSDAGAKGAHTRPRGGGPDLQFLDHHAGDALREPMADGAPEFDQDGWPDRQIFEASSARVRIGPVQLVQVNPDRAQAAPAFLLGSGDVFHITRHVCPRYLCNVPFAVRPTTTEESDFSSRGGSDSRRLFSATSNRSGLNFRPTQRRMSRCSSWSGSLQASRKSA